MKKISVFILAVMFVMTSCGRAPVATTNSAPSAATFTAIPTVLPSPTAITPTWQGHALIDERSPAIFANPGRDYQGHDIYASSIALDADTRWSMDVQVDKLAPDIGEASTGMIWTGHLESGTYPILVLVYQWGKWSLAYAPDSANPEFTYWKTMENLRTPAQHFELTLSQDGTHVVLNNGRSFAFQDTLPGKIFDGSQKVSTSVQIGPRTKITISKLAIDQLQMAASALPPDFAIPTAMAAGGSQPAYVFYVAADGDDNNPGTSDRPFASIEHARDVIRTINTGMQGPVVVYIHGGTYSVRRPVRFLQEDSGQNGYDIIYRAVDGETPVFSGGVSVSGWQQLPDSQVWKTVLPDVKGFRQLYVNGVRAQRAASQAPMTGLRWKAGDFSDRDGIVVAAGKLPGLARPQDLELHWIYDWKDMRLPAQAIDQDPDGTLAIRMKQPYFSQALSMGNSGHDWYPKFNIPFYLENALELLDQQGEWYYNADTHELFYMPRQGEDMSSVQAVIPQTQTLMEITGGMVGQEVHNLSFEGLSFAYAGWTRASQVGTFGWQAQSLIGGDASSEMTPAHVQVNSAHAIRFERCRFEHLGAAGLGLINDVYDVTVQGSLFHDISDGAVVTGHWDHAYITTPSVQAVSHHNLLADNLIDDVGVEYWGAPAITAYYVNNLQVVHNEISNVPYTGISMGWGWSSTNDSTTAHDNRVAYNLITDVTERARDGGGIYTLGQQPGTVVEGNVVRRMKGDYACLYPDEGSAYIEFDNNVCDDAPQWLHLWINTIHDNQILHTYTNVTRKENRGVHIQVEGTVYINGQAWTPEAQAIMDNAGLEPGYAYLHDWLNGQ